MSIIGALVIPIMICGIVLYGLFMRVNVFDCFVEGARDGMKTAVDILPPLLALVVAVSMLRTSGALGILVNILRPVSDFSESHRRFLRLRCCVPCLAAVRFQCIRAF